jgi:uncharacterized membrane protein YesL
VNWRPNDELFEFLDKASTFALANLLWVLLSIPLITLPMATAGLFATMSPWVRGKQPEIFQDFFSAMRRHWVNASIVGGIDLLVGCLIIFNFSIFQLMNMTQPLALLSRSMTLCIGLTALMANLYLWPLMVTFDLSLRELIVKSTKLVFAHPLWSIAMLILALVPFGFSIFLPAAILVTASFSCAALLINWAAWRVIRQYVAEDELIRLETRRSSKE